MGGAFSAPKQRYMKGKVPMKYWKEDMWPQMEDVLHKLNIDEQKGIDLFLAFCAMDADAGGTVDLEECFQYLGGVRTRYTERIWFAEPKINEDGEYEEGLAFKEFAFVVWNYCTLTAFQLGQSIFEIYDVENTDTLEKPDIESIYRLLYDCEEHDEYYLNRVPFKKEQQGDDVIEVVTKKDFSDHVAKNRHIIQPALDYQKRLRSKMGGYLMWENIAGFRRRMFMIYDTKASTMAEAMLQILASEDPNRKARKQAADRLLAERKAAAEAKQAAEEEELRAMDRAREEEQRRKDMSAEDRFLKLYWTALDVQRAEFEESEFLVDDAWKRKEKRDEMYRILDNFIDAQTKYWADKDDKELETMVGTDADHDARFKDLIKTADGKVTMEYTRLKYIFKMKDEQAEEKHLLSGSAATTKTKSHMIVLDAIVELEKKIERLMNNRAMIAAGALKSKAKAAQMKVVDFTPETQLAKTLVTKQEDAQVRENAKIEVWSDLKASTVSKAERFIEERRISRNMDIKRVEFEMATSYGSRETQWEYLLDRVNDKYVYVNSSTLEVMHAKTAICEACDSIFEQSDKKCKQCDLPRSTKNQLLYRPLGFKDIRID